MREFFGYDISENDDFNRRNCIPHEIAVPWLNDYFSTGGDIWAEVNNWCYEQVGLYGGTRDEWEESMFDDGPHRFSRYKDTIKSPVIFQFSHLEDAKLFDNTWGTKRNKITFFKNIAYVFGLNPLVVDFLHDHNYKADKIKVEYYGPEGYTRVPPLVKVSFDDKKDIALFKMFCYD
jgi:hypothetical protein